MIAKQFLASWSAGASKVAELWKKWGSAIFMGISILAGLGVVFLSALELAQKDGQLQALTNQVEVLRSQALDMQMKTAFGMAAPTNLSEEKAAQRIFASRVEHLQRDIVEAERIYAIEMRMKYASYNERAAALEPSRRLIEALHTSYDANLALAVKYGYNRKE